MQSRIMPKITPEQIFNRKFVFTLDYKGKTFSSIDELATFVKKNVPHLSDNEFFEGPVENVERIVQVHEPFNYIFSKRADAPTDFYKQIGFKIDIEPFYRIGPPHFEETTERLSFGATKGHRLYEGPEKKIHLLTYTP